MYFENKSPIVTDCLYMWPRVKGFDDFIEDRRNFSGHVFYFIL